MHRIAYVFILSIYVQTRPQPLTITSADDLRTKTYGADTATSTYLQLAHHQQHDQHRPEHDAVVAEGCQPVAV